MSDSAKKTVGCIAVAEHISKVIPATLWHYTSFEAFLGILTTGKIWATEYRFLNDREEFLHAKRLALELVEEEPETVGMSFPARELLRRGVNIAFNTGPLRPERLRAMVASFSEEGDQLSQWRGYSQKSSGISIGLDLQNLRPPADVQTTALFAPCVYVENQKRALLKAIFAHFTRGLQDYWEWIVTLAKEREGEPGWNDRNALLKLVSDNSVEQDKAIKRGQAELTFDLLRVALLLKDESFSEEREWRLVLPSETNKNATVHRIEYRSSVSGVVPYIPYPLRGPTSEDASAPCNDLILGPGSHPSAAVGVDMFFQSWGFAS